MSDLASLPIQGKETADRVLEEPAPAHPVAEGRAGRVPAAVTPAEGAR